MNKLRYTFKTDILFKMLFVQHQDLLKRFVAVLLGIAVEDIGQFVVRNPEIPPEVLEGKFCRLDINMTVNGQLVDLEIQVSNEGGYPDRSLYYWARGFSSSLPAGQKYASLPRTVVISIVDFNLFDCMEYHSCFQPLEITRHILLSDKMTLHFYELPKLPGAVDERDMLLLWLSLFKADTEEALTKIKAMEVPVMNQAIDAYYKITASSRFQEIERLRDKASHDEAQALYHAEQKGIQRGIQKGIQEGIQKGRQEGIQEGIQKGRQEGISQRSVEIAANLLQIGMPPVQVAAVTGLTMEELKQL